MWKPWIERISDGESEKCHIWRLHLADWPVRIYLHNLQRPDSDREMHNHPRPWVSLVLWGGYTDMAVDHPVDQPVAFSQDHGRGHVTWMPVTKFHRILRVKPNTWTLWLGRARAEAASWGFLMPDGVVMHHEQWREFKERERDLAQVQPNHEHTSGLHLTQDELVEHMRVQHAYGQFGETMIGQIYARMLHEHLHTPRWISKILDESESPR